MFDVTQKAYCLSKDELIYQKEIISKEYEIKFGEDYSLTKGISAFVSKLKQVGEFFKSKYKDDKLFAPVPRWFDGYIGVQKISFFHYFYYPMIKIFYY